MKVNLEKNLSDLSLKKGDIEGIGSMEETILEYKLMDYMHRMSTPLSLAKVKEIIIQNEYLNMNGLQSDYIINDEKFKEFRKRLINSKLFDFKKVVTLKGVEMEGIVLNTFYSSLYRDIVEINLLPSIFENYSNKNKNFYKLLDITFQENLVLYSDFLILVDDAIEEVLDYIIELFKEYIYPNHISCRRNYNKDSILENVKKQNKLYIPKVPVSNTSDILNFKEENIVENQQFADDIVVDLHHNSLQEFLRYIKENKVNYLKNNDTEKLNDLLNLDSDLFDLYKLLFKEQ